MSANGMGAAVSTEDEQIDVLRRHGEPAHFIWRGKLYRVRQVLSHWIQVGSDSGEIPSVLLRTDRRLGTVETLVFGRDREIERELWSVRASVGRDGDVAVFQLCHDVGAGGWLLVAESLSPLPRQVGDVLPFPEN